jgi:hypothetical protein
MGAIAKRLVFAVAAAAQVDGLCLLDHVPFGVFDHHPSGNLIGPIGQWRDDYLVFAHGRSMAPSSEDRPPAPLQQSFLTAILRGSTC